jgi:hypothetical protein
MNLVGAASAMQHGIIQTKWLDAAGAPVTRNHQPEYFEWGDTLVAMMSPELTPRDSFSIIALDSGETTA